MTFVRHPNFLRAVLFADAATCVATGTLLAGAAGWLAAWTQLPAELLRYAGISLFPIAAFILLVASRARPPTAGVWLVIIGNVGWVLASLGLLAMDEIAPNGLGYGFVIVQAAAVALLAELQFMGLSRSAHAHAT